jgi:hypothetical protein
MKKWEMRKIVHVEGTSDFTLICTFDNGELKSFQMKEIFRKKGLMIEPLRKPSFFKKVFIESGTPTWPNGFDVCADLIYKLGKQIKRGSKVA